jgi:hypothetical protein
MTQICQAKGCDREAQHYWTVPQGEPGEQVFAYLCSECKLAVQTPWMPTPELKGGGSRGGLRGDAKPAADAVPAVREVDGDGRET